MNYSAFFDCLKNETCPPCLLFYGEERYIQDSALLALRKAVLAQGLEELNESQLPSNCDGQTVWEDLQQLPVLSSKRLVFIKDWTAVTQGDKAPDIEILLSSLDRLPQTSVLVLFLTKKPDTRKKLYLALQKRGWVVEFSPVTEKVFYQFLNREAKKEGKTLTQDAAQLLQSYSLGLLSPAVQELNKALSFVGTRSVITQEDLRSLLPPSLHETVFDMVNNLCDGKKKEALDLLMQLRVSGAEPIAILAVLARTYRQLLYAKAMQNQKTPMEEMQKLLEISPFILRRVLARSSKLSYEKLKQGLKSILETEEGIKSGKLPMEAGFNLLFYRLLF